MIRNRIPRFAALFGLLIFFFALSFALKADDEGDQHRPTVHVSVTATGKGPLHYRWRATDGRIRDVDEPTTLWTLPSGPGLHFAYVLVSDHRGGYAEGRVAVNTDALDSELESSDWDSKPLKAPPSPVPVGDTYRGQLGYEASDGGFCYDGFDYSNGLYGCDVFAPGLQVYLQDSSGTRYPASGTVNTDALGFFTVMGVPAGNFTIYCDVGNYSVFTACGSDGIGSIADTDYYTNYLAASVSDHGSVLLADYSLCGTNNEFFGVHRSAKVTLLDAGGKALAAASVDGFGNYGFASPIAGAVTARFVCEGALSTSQPYVGGPFQFPGTGSPNIIAMTAPLDGNPGVFLPEVSGGFPADISIYTQRRDNFLAFKGLDSRNGACRYYMAIGAVRGCRTNGEFEGAVTFRDWQRSVHIGRHALAGAVKAHAAYVNAVDLNLTRVHDSVRYGTTSLATVVCNHKGPVVSSPSDVLHPPQSSIDTAVRNAINGKDLIACVAMDYQLNPGVNGDQKFVRFYIFGPNGELLPSVNLDGRGEKFMPGSCVSCHGGEHYAGHYPHDGTGRADFGGHMLPYDKGNFEFSDADGLSDAQREEAIYSLNQNLLAVDPPVMPQVEGALTLAGRKLITGWYSNPILPPHTLDQSYVPQEWQSFDQGYTVFNTQLSDPTNLFYRRVVARACRTCHVNQQHTPDFDNPGAVAGSPEMMHRTTCGSIDGNDLTHRLAVVTTMPNSVVTFNRYWLSQGTTDPATGESTDMPQILENFFGPGLNGGFCGNPPFIHY